jgi:hypothetical protein
MDRGQNIVVAPDSHAVIALLFFLIMCMWTLRHTRIAVLGFVTHIVVQAPLQSESHLYISRLVKTRDPYPGLLQICYQVSFFPISLPLLIVIFLFFLSFIHLYFQLYACLYLVEVLSGLLTHQGPIVVIHSVQEPSHVLHCHTPSPS